MVTENTSVTQRTTGLPSLEVEAVTGFITAMVEPLARSQETAAKETTRQVEIKSKAATKMAYLLFAVVVLLIGVATSAMFLNKEGMAQTVFSTVVFILGVSVGRTSKK